MTTLHWDLFCRVVDNLGDIGVCWRLAADLAGRGQRVRLWIDDAAALAWMAPVGAPGVAVHAWDDAEAAVPADVVVETFGCDPPPAFVARMAARAVPPLWLNLEYLSAEAYVERCHGLPSPQLSGPGCGLVKHFYYPGFTPLTGGLLREPDLAARRAAFDRDRWLAARGLERRAGESVLSLFCYPQAPLPLLWRALAGEPALVLLTPGAARTLAADHRPPPSVRTHALPWLSQHEYDHLLWSCDLNFVRGEDSAVRAMWAAVPFVWQLYPQHDGAHGPKLEAFLGRYAEHGAGPAAETAEFGHLQHAWRAWNGCATADLAVRWPDRRTWQGWCRRWRAHLEQQADLATQLLAWVAAQR